MNNFFKAMQADMDVLQELPKEQPQMQYIVYKDETNEDIFIG